jgi:hypothetical protein
LRYNLFIRIVRAQEELVLTKISINMTTKCNIICFLTLFFSFSLNQASAQNNLIMTSPSGMITVHTSREHYTTGESLSFKACLQKDDTFKEASGDISLYAAVVDQEGTEVANGIFPVKNGHAMGDLYLSGQMTNGNYILIVCPSTIKNPAPGFIFSKIIWVDSQEKNSYTPHITLSDSIYNPGSSLKATISFLSNDNELVPLSYEYKLINGPAEILSGKGKSEKNKPSSLVFTVPSFNNNDKIVLYVSATYKGIKRNTGIVIPTSQEVSAAKINSSDGNSSGVIKALKITIKPGKLIYESKEKIEAEIIVTDDKGVNVSTDLAISANNLDLIPGTIQDNSKTISEPDYNSLWYKVISGSNDPIQQVFSADKGKNDQREPLFSEGMRKLYTGYLSSIMQTSGLGFLVQEKNDIKKINDRKTGATTGKQTDYSSERSIYDILMKIKPYTLVDNKIIFPSSGITSLNNQDGALIVIDGIKFGTTANALSNVAVSDILKITASTNSMDVQKYSGLNSVGVVEVFTKTGAASIPVDESQVITNKNPLFWATDVKTNFFGKATVSFYNNKPAPVRITVTGISDKGETGSNSIVINTK